MSRRTEAEHAAVEHVLRNVAQLTEGTQAERVERLLSAAECNADASKMAEMWGDKTAEQARGVIRKRYTPGITALTNRLLEAAGVKNGKPDPQHELADIDNGEDAGVDAGTDDPPEPECLVCGCTQDHACDGGCSWLALDRVAGVGVCSSCAKTKKQAEKMLDEHLVTA